MENLPSRRKGKHSMSERSATAKFIVSGSALLMFALCALAPSNLQAEPTGPKDGNARFRRVPVETEELVPVAIRKIKKGDVLSKANFKAKMQKISSSDKLTVRYGSDAETVSGAKATRDIPVGKIITTEDANF